MTTEPKLLTEAEARSMLLSLGNGWTVDDQINHLRERGLIAEEPVDPFRDALENAVKVAIKGKPSFWDAIDDLARELRARGMELAPRKELTREMVEQAIETANDNFETDEEGRPWDALLHAALTEALQ